MCVTSYTRSGLGGERAGCGVRVRVQQQQLQQQYLQPVVTQRLVDGESLPHLDLQQVVYEIDGYKNTNTHHPRNLRQNHVTSERTNRHTHHTCSSHIDRQPLNQCNVVKTTRAHGSHAHIMTTGTSYTTLLTAYLHPIYKYHHAI